MNKFAIPAILAATVMVAGMFAFMPVEQASTVHLSGTATVTIAANQINAAALADDAITEINDGSLGSDVLSFFTTDLQAETNNDITATSTTDFVACITVDNGTAADATLTVTTPGGAVVFDVYQEHSLNLGCFGSTGGTEITFGSAAALDAHATLIAEEDAVSTLVGNT